MEKQSDFSLLFHKLMGSTCSPEEVDRLMRMLLSKEGDIALLQRIQEEMKTPVSPAQISEETRQRLQEILKGILSAEVESPQYADRGSIVSHKFWKYAVAASVLLILGAGGCLFFLARPLKKATIAGTQQTFKNDVPPGGNRAELTLANGATIVLNSAHNGQLANQGNIKVVKVKSGLLAYSQQPVIGSGLSAVDNKESAVSFNTLRTPRGGQYQLVLPDGSRVWLNAASSIRFPTAFSGRVRKVEITGEAYFEVVHNASAPFKVTANKVVVEVLGTHFNINAYNDEATVRTTLLEGSVRVTPTDSPFVARRSQLLAAGEQAQVDAKGQIRLIKDVDTDEAVSWKNGYFSFDQADLKTVMRQLSRWYNVDVYYEGEISRQLFGGEIQRNLNLSQVLTVLEKSQVHFKIEGSRLIVIP